MSKVTLVLVVCLLAACTTPSEPMRGTAVDQTLGSPSALTMIVVPGGVIICTRCS